MKANISEKLYREVDILLIGLYAPPLGEYQTCHLREKIVYKREEKKIVKCENMINEETGIT
jgi:hypothetical protein